MSEQNNYTNIIKRLIDFPTLKDFEVFCEHYFYETDKVDFKSDYIEYSKLAKHMMAMGNNGGGIICLGINELDNQKYQIVGVRNVLDNADFSNKIKKFIPRSLHYNHTCLSYSDNDLKIIIISIKSNDINLPYICEQDGTSIKSGDVYIRRDTKSIKAVNYDIDQIYKRKSAAMNLISNSKDLTESVRKLKVLYDSIEKTKRVTSIGKAIVNAFSILEENIDYPEESYDKFISDCISIQKVHIKSTLG